MDFKYPERTSDKYYSSGYWHGDTPSFVEIRGLPVEIPELAGFDMFASRGYDLSNRKAKVLRGGDWDIYEGLSGKSLGIQLATTADEAVTRLRDKIRIHTEHKNLNARDKMTELLSKTSAISPRYGG